MKETTIMKIIKVINEDCTTDDIHVISNLLERRYLKELIRKELNRFVANAVEPDHKQAETNLMRDIQNIDVD